MRIDRIEISNFKGFASQVLELRRSLDAGEGTGSFHLLIGRNGTGKTSALDALAVAAGSWLLGVRGQDSRHIQSDDVRVVLRQHGDTHRLEPQFPVSVSAEGTVQGEALQWERTLSGQSGRTTRVGAKSIKEVAERAAVVVRDGGGVSLPLLAYYGTGRLWQEPKDTAGSGDLADAFASRLDGYRYAIDPRCSPRDLLRWLEFEQRIADHERRESTQFGAAKAAIAGLVEDCQGLEYHPRLGLLLDFGDAGRLPFGNLSDGQRNMAALVGDMAHRAAQLNPHLGEAVLDETPGIVLIDELDLHLHPTWQRHLVEDLRGLFPQVQFIATTHSPFIVQTMRDEEVIALDAQTVPNVARLGVEEIARGLMGVERPEVAPRYHEMVEVAKDYLQTLEEASDAPQEKLADYKRKLAEGLGPYADNPAFQALLEMERVAALGE